MKRGRVLWIIAIILLLAAIILFIFNARLTGNVVAGNLSANSNQQDAVTRTILGTLSNMQITLIVNSNSYVIGISETIPSGCNVSSVSEQGILKTDTVEWLYAPAKNAKILYYTLACSSPQDLFGEWYTLENQGTILGDSQTMNQTITNKNTTNQTTINQTSTNQTIKNQTITTKPATSQLLRCVLTNGDQFASVSSNCEGQKIVGPLGYLLVNNPSGGVGIYRCSLSGQLFESANPNCEGGSVKQALLGYAYGSNAAGTAPLYRCRIGKEYLSSRMSNCEGAAGAVNEGVVAYVLTMP